LAEQAKPTGALTAGWGTESLTRQDRLLCVLVENFQPVWHEIEEADLFRRRGLASREGLLVPQHVMIGLVMVAPETCAALRWSGIWDAGPIISTPSGEHCVPGSGSKRA